MNTDSQDVLAIQNLIARFANCFDLKDWDGLGACLADTLHTDYSDLRGTPPETVTRDVFVALRRQALAPLQTHHLAGNVEIATRRPGAQAKVSMVIFRHDPDGEVLNTHCLYHFGLDKSAEGEWRISAIVQKVYWSEGNRAIHAGIRKPPAGLG